MSIQAARNLGRGSTHPVARNPLRTREDVQEALTQLLEPLNTYYSEGRARLILDRSGVDAYADIAEMEGFSRVLWGLVPAVAGGSHGDLWELSLQGIRSGTDPEHAEYWGKVKDYDQRLVEMAVFGLAFALIPDRIWQPLSEKEKSNLYQWLDQINYHPCYDCNWLFFHVFVNVGFRKAGLPYNAGQLENNLQRIEEFYLNAGWYSDGIGGHSDYYVPYAFHFYGLIYAQLMGEEDPERAGRYRERAALFARDFVHWFAPDGPAVPYGRSLTYRFAQSAFWSAAAYAGLEGFSPGQLKGLVLRNLRWWFQQPIFDRDGVLTVGYAYPNRIMSENYNAAGSVYWSLKTFLILALPEEHPFWTAEEQELAEPGSISVQEPAHLVLCRDEQTGHVAAFNTGHPSTNEHTHTSAKYEKFVYSTAFAFSVPRAEWGLAQGAFDSMLALSEGDRLYRVKRLGEETRIQEHVLYARWKPWRDVEVRTWIAAGLPWHIRIHRISTGRILDAAEGGFALGLGSLDSSSAGEGVASASGTFGTSAIYGMLGYDTAELIYPHAHTNLLRPRTVIPTLRAALEPGTHWLISAVFGDPSAPVIEEPSMEAVKEGLGVEILHRQIKITTQNGNVIVIPMD
ncbi:DUF2264 domain-containing protein [Paenibacillus lautus]|uniref:DUF2264 domain-containing protein n=1 Tax=Paenibacillus lautus TaxID=1401 RepID=UPI002DC059C4|nr:DUF2264 domain-containing protein [Paenibacillus lautus]MEC0305769.1 DUF2264 domain-containing protein [Paenibacillus lautus]